jgi:hypothetical protein
MDQAAGVRAGTHLAVARLHAGVLQLRGQDPGSWGRLRVGYPWGPRAFFSYIGRRRRSGTFDGLAFR